jgi:hypothetical protein
MDDTATATEAPSLDALRLQLAELDVAITAADAALTEADEIVAACQAELADQQVAAARARQAYVAGTSFEEQTTTDHATGLYKTQRGIENRKDEEAAAEYAEGRRERADANLSAALVARTKAAEQRGFYRMMRRRVETAIEAAEAEAERQRLAAARDRDFLTTLRDRVMGRAG